LIEEQELEEKYLHKLISKEHDRISGDRSKGHEPGSEYLFDAEMRLAQNELRLKQCKYTLGRLYDLKRSGITAV
jgi:hypothetical protein